MCDPAILEQTIRQNLGSDAKLAAYLGVGKHTAREYRMGRISLPRSYFEKLQTLNPALSPLKTMDAFWGMRKGGTLRTVSHEPARGCKLASLVVDDIAKYDLVPPSAILERALAKHKEALAEFVGRIFGDGSPIIAPTYSACEIDSQKRMQILVLELFDYRPEIRIAKGNYRMQLRRICGRTLNLLGIPFGRKSVTNPSVPAFIMERDEPTMWLSFLRGLFDDEAYVSARGIEIGLAVRQVSAVSFANNLTGSRILDDVSELLRRLGIQHVRRKGQTYQVGETRAICWFLRIPRREFKKVHELGLFLLAQKQQKLVAAL